DAAGSVQDAVGSDAVECAAEEPHPLPLDADRSVVAGVAGAVDDETTRNQEIQHGGPCGGQAITEALSAAARGGGSGAPPLGAGAPPPRAGRPGRARR